MLVPCILSVTVCVEPEAGAGVSGLTLFISVKVPPTQRLRLRVKLPLDEDHQTPATYSVVAVNDTRDAAAACGAVRFVRCV